MARWITAALLVLFIARTLRREIKFVLLTTVFDADTVNPGSSNMSQCKVSAIDQIHNIRLVV